MKILVTGGAGFIGSHLCNRLASEGHDVTSFDWNYVNVGQELAESVRKIEGDIRFTIPDEHFDWIFNLACTASPQHYTEAPIDTAMTSALGAYNCLELAGRFQKPTRVFQASTSEIYGDPLISPQHEDYWGHVNPIGPRACYDEGKRFAETLFYDYQRRFMRDIRVARIFNTYGPAMYPYDGRVVSNFIVAALRERPLYVYGDGTQTRSLCYIDDTIEGILTLMRSEETRPVNIGRDSEMSVIDLAKIILDMTKSKSKIEYYKLPENDPMQRRPDLNRIRSLGWNPKTKLYEGLEKTIEYYRGII